MSTRSQIQSYLKSLPPHLFGGYGGNTPCVEVRSDTARVIIDAGSGIRQLGYELLGGPCGKGQGDVHILFTHFHWDHLIGLPFFTPIFIPGNTLHLYCVEGNTQQMLETVFQKPYFPVPLNALGSKIITHVLEPRKQFSIGDISITPYKLDHPDPCWGYKFEHQGKVYSHCVDTECTRVSREALGLDLPLYQNVDLMVFDAQYTLMETIEKVNWGHAAASLGIDIALRENVKRVLFMHFDPAAPDERIKAAEQQARRYYLSQLKAAQKTGKPFREVDWGFAIEGMTVEL